MKIVKIDIIQFGKLSNATFEFENGFNVVRGDNESGKSTLLAFIKFALYGVGRKNPNVTVGERERAISWHTGIAAGALTVSDNEGNLYRIERSGRADARGAYVDRARIIDVSSGEEVFGDEIPGEHFLGINAQAYDSMCNIKQLESSSINSDAVKGVIENLLSGGSDTTDVRSAIKLLDGERRKLLHANGKGGLIYESELAIEKLQNEHKSSISFENDREKNLDELERVELALQKARDEHEIAQRMCDLHDDVLRLRKFEELRTLSAEAEKFDKRAKEIEAQAGFDTSFASYERVAEIKSAADSLTSITAEHEIAVKDYKNTEDALAEVTVPNAEIIAELVDELGSPNSAVNYLDSKQKKKSNAAFMITTFGIGGGFLLVFAAFLAFVMQNIQGSLTVAFIGAALSAVAVVFSRQFASAKSEINDFTSRLGKEICPKDHEKILEHLQSFEAKRALKTQRTNAFENAKFRLSVAKDKFNSDTKTARRILQSVGVSYTEGNEVAALNDICTKMKGYLAAMDEFNNDTRESSAMIKALRAELEYFNESSIRARITPEIEEKITNTTFERLKTERDLALHRTNQYGQYKAAIERNLASFGTIRDSNDIFPEIEAEQEHLASLNLRLEAIRLATDTINTASLRIKSDITPRIKDSAQNSLSIVTDGKYNELLIDDNMSLSYFANGETRPIDSLSKGTLDVAYLAVRLALVETVLGDRCCPIFMDEPLSQLDDNRAKNVIRTINNYAKDNQCIMFTCQNRDVEIVKTLVNANIIEI